ncbi:hypothetical protein T10_48 [Trichinella papuae]|uniref:Uncharacterized protein n=1 Tax=Trichinella papuae TaxID=268474 RepID=A0A0V1MA65_9BILA|nr:hypothetical protein T10_48 [Trichinella papuae]
MAKINECKKFCEFSKYLNKRGLESQNEKTHNLYSKLGCHIYSNEKFAIFKTVKQVHQWSALQNCPYCECSGEEIAK